MTVPPAPARTFSIVIPTFDRPRELERCLSALARLDFPRAAFEVIVVDDGSSAPVEPALAAAGGLRVRLERSTRGGPAKARNLGAAVATGRYVAFTDDDCEAAPDWLAEIEHAFAGGAAAVLGRATNAVHGNTCADASQLLIDHLLGYYNRDPRDARFGTSNNLAVERQALLEAGGFDESFERAAGEDRELVHRLRARGHRLVYEPRAAVAHHHRQDMRQFWRQHYGYGRAAVRFRRRAGQVDIEPLSFYTGLVRAPRPSDADRTRLVALLVLSQVANAAGFARESAAPSPTPTPTP